IRPRTLILIALGILRAKFEMRLLPTRPRLLVRPMLHRQPYVQRQQLRIAGLCPDEAISSPSTRLAHRGRSDPSRKPQNALLIRQRTLPEKTDAHLAPSYAARRAFLAAILPARPTGRRRSRNYPQRRIRRRTHPPQQRDQPLHPLLVLALR